MFALTLFMPAGASFEQETSSPTPAEREVPRLILGCVDVLKLCECFWLNICVCLLLPDLSRGSMPPPLPKKEPLKPAEN